MGSHTQVDVFPLLRNCGRDRDLEASSRYTAKWFPYVPKTKNVHPVMNSHELQPFNLQAAQRWLDTAGLSMIQAPGLQHANHFSTWRLCHLASRDGKTTSFWHFYEHFIGHCQQSLPYLSYFVIVVVMITEVIVLQPTPPVACFDRMILSAQGKMGRGRFWKGETWYRFVHRVQVDRRTPARSGRGKTLCIASV